MQAAITIDRSGTIGRPRLLARLGLALAAAVALGFGLGYVAVPAGHASQPAVKVMTVPATATGCGEALCPTHGALP